MSNKDWTYILYFTIIDRGEDGELRLGIRRAAQLKSCSNFSSLSGQQFNLGSLTDVVNALSTRCAFSIHYNPRYISGYSLILSSDTRLFGFLFIQARELISVFYRVGSSEFIVPIQKFLKSLDYSYSVGMRFRMRFESEDAAERRFVIDYASCI